MNSSSKPLLPIDPDDPEAFSLEAQRQRDEASFEDFLVAPQISGKQRSVIHRSRIPAEVVLDTGKILEISYDQESDTPESSDTILINRREDQTIESIEIHCSCGKRFIIQFQPESETEHPSSSSTPSAPTDASEEPSSAIEDANTQSESSAESPQEPR